MKVFVEPSHELPLVQVELSMHSGAAQDPPGKEGLTKLTMRMLRRGGAGLTSTEIAEKVDTLGGEFSADTSLSSASASFEVIKRSLGSMASLFARLLAEPAFDEAELGRLKREAEAELIEARDSDGTLLSRALRRTIFEGHPYGRRVSGSIASLRSITRDDVVRCYAAHLRRGNISAAVSGDLVEPEARALVDRLVASLPAGPRGEDSFSPAAARKGRHLVFVDKPDRTQTQMSIGCLGTHPRDPDHTALHVAVTAFGGTFTSRLMQEVRVKRGWSYGSNARVGTDRQREAFTMSAAPAAADAPACLALLLELLEAFVDRGIEERELEFTKNYLIRSHAFDVDTARKRVHHALEVDVYDLPADYHTGYLDRVAAVTLDDANRAIKARLSASSFVAAVVGTHAEIGAAIEKALPGLESVVVAPFDQE